MALITKLLARNRTKICALRFNEYSQSFGTINFKFMNFYNLIRIGLFDFCSSTEELAYLLNNLPPSIQELNISFTTKNEVVWVSDLFTKVFCRLHNLSELHLENFDIRNFNCISSLFELGNLTTVYLYGEFGIQVAKELSESNPMRLSTTTNWANFSLKLNKSFGISLSDFCSIPNLELIDFSESNFEAEEVVEFFNLNFANFFSLEKIILPIGEKRNAVLISEPLAHSHIRIESDDELLVLLQDKSGRMHAIPYFQ